MPRQPSLPTTRDVARLAGVSPATVSYVLNGRPEGEGTISAATRQRVLEAVNALGYVPNQTARSLRRQRTERVCLVLPRLGAPAYEVLTRDAQSVADTHGYSVILSIAGSPERERQVVDQLQRRLADGAILVYGFAQEDDLVALKKAGIALVVFRNHMPPDGFDVVRTQEAEACYEAVRYLLQQGRRRIAFIGHFGHLEYPPDQYDRFDSYQRALLDYGHPLVEQLIRGGADSRSEAYQNALDLLRLPERPDAFFAGSDIAAVSAIWAIRDAGLRIPDDIAVIGVGNIAEGEIINPALSTVGPASLGYKDVADLLFSRLDDPTLPGRTHLIEWELILRGSA